MSGAVDDFLGLFRGAKRKEDEAARVLPRDEAYIEEQLSDQRLEHTLAVVDAAVDMKEWLFSEETSGWYRNESLERAILIGEEVQQVRAYMAEDRESYEGAELNSDVLKTVLAHFLRTMECYEFSAFDFDLKALVHQIENTPGELLKYLVEERGAKLREKMQNAQERGTSDFARRIFEYDLLVQRRAGEGTPPNGASREYARCYEEALRVKEVRPVIDEEHEGASSNAIGDETE